MDKSDDEDTREYSCEFCAYVSARAYNLKRHVQRFHADSLDIGESKHVHNSPDAIIRSHSDGSEGSDGKTCATCNRTFCRADYARQHQAHCKGKRSLTCPCGKSFASFSNQNRHALKCEVAQTQVTKSGQCIAFDRSRIMFHTDHIDAKSFLAMSKVTEIHHAIDDLFRAVYDRPENKCVRKLNAHSKIVQVHLGNDKWVSRHQDDVVKSLVTSLANSLSELLYVVCEDPKIRRRMGQRFQSLEDMLTYVSDDGRCSDRHVNKKDIGKCYRHLLRETAIRCVPEKQRINLINITSS